MVTKKSGGAAAVDAESPKFTLEEARKLINDAKQKAVADVSAKIAQIKALSQEAYNISKEFDIPCDFDDTLYRISDLNDGGEWNLSSMRC